ncbi:glycogen biosynthesis protein GlgD [Bacillus sp. CGMCC 1.16607]|uniref:glycogen biosynthesis protein GlgD n=1 Tax=Bacillus sp. CGMCC 1.16607 TaxID=3351842 RepID=UPI00364003C0
MAKRSKMNNPEQKTRNGSNNQDVEFGQDMDVIKKSKLAYEKTGGQPVKSKMHQEQNQTGRTRH